MAFSSHPQQLGFTRYVNRWSIRPPTRLSSGGGVVFSCCSGGGGGGVMAMVGGGGHGLVRTASPGDGGGGGGHTADLVSVESQPATLALICNARVPVGRPLGPIRIRAVCLYASLVGDSGTGMTSTGSSLLSFKTMVTSSPPSAALTPSFPSSPPSLGLGAESTNLYSATG
jgi:hypothetical protein